jgi:hypothetical protein
MRPWIFPTFSPLAVTALALAGIITLGQWAEEDLRSRQEYNIRFLDIQSEPPACSLADGPSESAVHHPQPAIEQAVSADGVLLPQRQKVYLLRSSSGRWTSYRADSWLSRSASGEGNDHDH